MAAWQAWLLLAGAAALAAGLFFIKLRPPRKLIPSLLLWRRVLDEAREQTLWERIRRAVSLVLTILIALALAAAVTRPARGSGDARTAAGRLLVVIDASWSMQAHTRSGETRWERAVAEARRLFSAASGSELALATTADGLVEGPTTDAALIETALDRVGPGGGETAAWPQLAGTGAVHFITDGAMARTLDPNVVVHSVFEPASNVAVTALNVRPSLVPANAADAYLEIANFAPAAQKAHVRLFRGSASVFDRELDMGANEVLRQVVPLPRGADQSLRARVDARHNGLDADDEAYAWVERARPLSVLVVGERTDWLRAAFDRDPDIRAAFIQPASYRDPSPDSGARPDVVIFDRWAPMDPPQGPSLLFRPPSATGWLADSGLDPAPAVRRSGAEERRPRWEMPGTHPVVQGVDPFTLTIERGRAYARQSLNPIARSSTGMPLISVDESPDWRRVIVGFGPDDSNLTAAPGFPVLLGNSLEWLARPDVVATTAGQTVSGHVHKPGLVAFEGVVVKVTGPRSTAVPLLRVNDRAMARLHDPGLYTVEGGGARSTVAINVGSPQLSNLTRTTPISATQPRAVTAGGSARPWWLYSALAAFMLGLFEWWTWQRRITV
jgi:hypothetical protein